MFHALKTSRKNIYAVDIDALHSVYQFRKEHTIP